VLFLSASAPNSTVSKHAQTAVVVNTIRYDNEIVIVRSKADYSQLNLPHCIITKNNDKNLKNKDETSQKYRKQTRSCEVSAEERGKSLWWEWFQKKVGFKLAVKERGSYGWWKKCNTNNGNDGSRKRKGTVSGEIRLMQWRRKLVPETWKERSVIHREDDVDRRATVTRDVGRVLLCGGWTVMTWCRYGGLWKELVFNAFSYLEPVKTTKDWSEYEW